MAYAIFLESGLVLIMVELALNSSVKRLIYSHEFFRALTFSTRKYIKFSFLLALAENIVILISKLIGRANTCTQISRSYVYTYNFMKLQYNKSLNYHD